ncbi:MAG: hypothetical protein OXK73_09210 [Rhodospirillaceae bacterium]|nr:hypothetical protein [Rhodospirillaceae bacterium]
MFPIEKTATAWFMLHRIRKAWASESDGPFDGPVEVDEAYFGGDKKSTSKKKRREVFERGPAGKHHMRASAPLVQMRYTFAGIVVRNLLYCDLVANNGLPSGSGL